MTEEKYRKILDGVMEQAEKDFGEDINVPNKIELSDEEIVKALDICTTADDDMDCIDDCPMYEEDYCTTKLLKMAFDLIQRLRKESATQKAENEKLHTLTDMQEANVNTLFENNMGLRKEIERLTEENDHFFLQMTTLEGIMYAKIQQAVKDTAKEILCELLDIEVKDEDYEMFFLDVCDKLEKFAQKYGVEVE